jgi:hypothetical protein
MTILRPIFYLVTLVAITLTMVSLLPVGCASARADMVTRPRAQCWVLYAMTGDIIVGSTSGGINTVQSTVASRKATTVTAFFGARAVTTTSFSGGVVSTHRAWGEIRAAERL